jgi:hypothetical protein
MFGLTCDRLHRRHWICTIVTDAPGIFSYTLCQRANDALAFSSEIEAQAFAVAHGIATIFRISAIEMEKAGGAQPPPA